ncbi:MAG: hypothetical protein ACK55O_09330, partial [Phycisphaerales bacterium]
MTVDRNARSEIMRIRSLRNISQTGLIGVAVRAKSKHQRNIEPVRPLLGYSVFVHPTASTKRIITINVRDWRTSIDEIFRRAELKITTHEHSRVECGRSPERLAGLRVTDPLLCLRPLPPGAAFVAAA